MITYGWCRGIEDAELLKRLGYDYMECTVVSLQVENADAHREALSIYLESPLPVSAFSVFFPGDIKLIGPERDTERTRRYIHAAAEAMHRIGAKTVVLGSGRSRNVPEGWERARGEEEMLHTLEWIAGDFGGAGLTLAIEPLNKKECNFINSVDDAVAIAKQINHPAVRVLADFYHMEEENEALDTLTRNKDWLAHIHLADTGRLAPGTGSYPYAEFAARLKAAGYQGMISAECGVGDVEKELTESLAFMKRTFG
ncbi:sugar phosphate isomerase/epimerase family protein [Paenibacillus sacheonensis]|uniref:TIM barrel protein n=1 Tax=Paenibacillus sacheonensis TaxID=742054 RepID=A0A7X5C0J9_9BACL|nr:sugar phosphate isomerase/epimerase family protein [Paenibacillus sacheonensis]MBM7568195.1 sugar phosphate isomerase/epimerase [Paenibacillus sacheonensis]NBC71807.1 TIM barrel protein [Paenibacillus sacheonensis]